MWEREGILKNWAANVRSLKASLAERGHSPKAATVLDEVENAILELGNPDPMNYRARAALQILTRSVEHLQPTVDQPTAAARVILKRSHSVIEAELRPEDNEDGLAFFYVIRATDGFVHFRGREAAARLERSRVHGDTGVDHHVYLNTEPLIIGSFLPESERG